MTTEEEGVKFVKGLEDNLTPVTSITAGGFKLVEGSSLATGFGNEAASGEVVSSVTVSANNNTSVLNAAKVVNHVLSFDTTNVTSMSSMFSNCSNLTSLNVSNFNTNKVTNMSNMFQRCSSLTSLDLSNWNTENVTNMNYMFQNCSKLSSIP